MGIIMSKDVNNSSELDRRISADLRARTQNRRDEDVDYEIDESTETTKKTGKYGWIWIVLIVLAIISLLCIVFI